MMRPFAFCNFFSSLCQVHLQTKTLLMLLCTRTCSSLHPQKIKTVRQLATSCKQTGWLCRYFRFCSKCFSRFCSKCAANFSIDFTFPRTVFSQQMQQTLQQICLNNLNELLTTGWLILSTCSLASQKMWFVCRIISRPK